jgi:NADH/NAD ratio-sensing transcriptional regulator Rex
MDLVDLQSAEQKVLWMFCVYDQYDVKNSQIGNKIGDLAISDLSAKN